jgi:hypothetical protein
MTAHTPQIEQGDEISIRRLGAEDMAALELVAQRDTSPAPAGALLGALVDGRLVAATSLDSGASVADPFLPSAAAQALLAERARQLRGRGRGRISSRRVLGRRRHLQARSALG